MTQHGEPVERVPAAKIAEHTGHRDDDGHHQDE
jgi:hypothetical protein